MHEKLKLHLIHGNGKFLQSISEGHCDRSVNVCLDQRKEIENKND